MKLGARPENNEGHSMRTRSFSPVVLGSLAASFLFMPMACQMRRTGPSVAPSQYLSREAQASVVRILVTVQPEDYAMPWQSGDVDGVSGTGFVISEKRILTNAHMVSDAKFVEVQKHGDATRYKARVTFIGHDCDLAIVTVDDPAFFQDTIPLTFAGSTPSLNDEVEVFGYPLGGDRLSITRGVVSRIDYSVYSHSGIDSHMVLQVDAAINPGNSGGPVLFNGRVIGVAFQGISDAENIGYAIPLPVVQHFLTDTEDGIYNGYPELGVSWLDMPNEALRKAYQVPRERTGILVYYTDPFGSGYGRLFPGDVLLSVDGHAIESDASIDLGDQNAVLFTELLERKQWGESVAFEVWRSNACATIVIPLTNPVDPFVYRNTYDRKPEYYIRAGLVFAPMTREFLLSVEGEAKRRNDQQLFYYSLYAKTDELYHNIDEFVVLIARLPHPINTYADSYINGILTNVNGVAVRNLRSVKSAMEAHTNVFHTLAFAGSDDILVLRDGDMKKADPEISASYGINSNEYYEAKE
jgi:S1-C subfamily serine protease